MIVDCERCPGQHLSPPACPSCVVQLVLQTAPAPPRRTRTAGAPSRGVDRVPVDLVAAPEGLPVAVSLLPRVDDHGRALDAAEQRAVAVLAAAGMLPHSGPGPDPRDARYDRSERGSRARHPSGRALPGPGQAGVG